MLPMASTLSAHHLAKAYGGRPVVKDVSLQVSAGEIVGLLGPNGAGKTTCFYMILGLVEADAGDIRLDGESLVAMPMHRRARAGIGYLPQEASIFRGLTVEANLNAVLEISIKDHAERRKQLDSLLAEFSITHIRQASAISLSGCLLYTSPSPRD